MISRSTFYCGLKKTIQIRRLGGVFSRIRTVGALQTRAVQGQTLSTPPPPTQRHHLLNVMWITNPTDFEVRLDFCPAQNLSTISFRVRTLTLIIVYSKLNYNFMWTWAVFGFWFWGEIHANPEPVYTISLQTPLPFSSNS